MLSLSLWTYLLCASTAVEAHSWVEQLMVIKNGSYTGLPGYMRGYNPRGPGFTDFSNQNLVPPLATGRIRINGSDPMCRVTQTTRNQTAGYPRLNAAAGDYVALRYLENGHVTLPQNQLGKPGSGGTVLVYATTQPKEDEKLLDVLRWDVNGTSGDKRGRLLTVQNFDDGRCYQINSSPISTQRQQQFPNKPADAPPGTQDMEMWCETNVRLPDDLAADKDVTLYWAWQWNTLPNMNPGMPEGKDEWYTSCIDVNILAAGAVSKAALPTPKQLLVQDPQQDANPDFLVRAANVSLPDGGADGGDFNAGNAANLTCGGPAPPGPPPPPPSGSAAAAPSGAPPAPPSGSAPAPPASGAAPPPTGCSAPAPPADGAPPPPDSAAPTPPAASAPPSGAAGSGDINTLPTFTLLPLPGTSALPPPPVPSGLGSGLIGSAHGHSTPHTLTLTQVMTLTVDYKRSVETLVPRSPGAAALRARNVWA